MGLGCRRQHCLMLVVSIRMCPRTYVATVMVTIIKFLFYSMFVSFPLCFAEGGMLRTLSSLHGGFSGMYPFDFFDEFGRVPSMFESAIR